jgi:clan AA aspartic protease
MGLFDVPVTLINPDDRQRAITIAMLVDTGSTYMLLPPEVVAALALPIREQREAELASGERVLYGVGEVRVRLFDREYANVFVAGPPGCPTLLGAFTLEAFGLAADPVHERIFPVVARL